MHTWFTKKLNEMIGLAQYCQFPILQAHFVMTKKAVDEMYGEAETDTDPLADVLPLLISQAATNNQPEAQRYLELAYISLRRPVSSEENIVAVDFSQQASDARKESAGKP